LGLAILLFFLGLVLVVLEIFFPSFGVLSMCAAASFIGGVILAFQESTVVGFLYVGATAIVIPILLWFGFRMLPRTPFGRRIVLRLPPSRAAGGEATGEATLVGKEGCALGDLRPAGFVEIEGRRLDAVTRGEYLERGARVRVIRHEGRRIVVEGADGAGPPRKKPRWA